MTVDLSPANVSTARGPRTMRWTPLTGFTFVACFAASVAASNVPADTAPDREWTAAYVGVANQTEHLVTGVLLVLAGVSLVTFLGYLWSTVAATREPGSTSPIPLLLAAAAAACIAVGGVLMAGISGAVLTGHGPLPSAELLRLVNDLGFGMVSVGGMSFTAFAVFSLSILAHRAAVFGRALEVLGMAAAVLLLGAVFFLPIVGLLVWVILAAIALLRSRPASKVAGRAGLAARA